MVPGGGPGGRSLRTPYDSREQHSVSPMRCLHMLNVCAVPLMRWIYLGYAYPRRGFLYPCRAGTPCTTEVLTLLTLLSFILLMTNAKRYTMAGFGLIRY